MIEIVHVLPENDLKPHTESGLICDCQPKIDRCVNGIVVIHNSYDGREILEEAAQYAWEATN